MGVILAKFRKEKSTEAVLEALQEKIKTLETFTVNTQEQKKRIVHNFLTVSIAVYVIAFVVFYFVYFPHTWKDRIFYCIPLLLFPIIIILLRYLFTWYFQRKLNKNSKKLTALKAEKKKILEQVMDKETYKVAVNLLARYADKPSKPSFALSPTTPNKPLLNRSLPAPNVLTQRSQHLSLSTTPQLKSTLSSFASPRSQTEATSSPTTALLHNNSGVIQQLRRRTPFPIVNQQEKGIFDRIVDVIIGDGPQDRFAMICKECYSHNGMASKDDFEYTTFRCAFCNALNPARKNRPAAPRLSVLPVPAATTISSDTSDSEDDEDESDDEPSMELNINAKQFSTPEQMSFVEENNENDNTPAAATLSATSNLEEENADSKITSHFDKVKEGSKGTLQRKATSSDDEFVKQLQKSDSAIEDTSMSPE